MPQTVLRPFMSGNPLEVVRLPPADGNGERLGVLSEDGRVWIERDLQPTYVANSGSLEKVQLPPFPPAYGEWKYTSIGGVSKTVRRVNIVRAGSRAVGPIHVFAVHCPHARSIPDMLGSSRDVCDVGEPQFVDETYGIVTEVTVERPEDLAHVCALVAKAGCTVLLSREEDDARRCLGVERLDRIGAEVVCESDMYEENDGIYGLRRGNDNWMFPFLPDGWRVPITWDHMVDNVIHEDLETIPQPLQQHVAKRLLRTGKFRRIGSVWSATRLTDEEAHHPMSMRSVLSTPSDGLVDWIREGNAGELPPTVTDAITLRTIIKVGDTWFEPRDTSASLKKLCATRKVSAALDRRQSQQLITAFFFLCIDRRQPTIVNHAFILIMYHYMKERGYTSRWMGKYEQLANHVGNGDKFRNFTRLETYRPHLLPADVLNKLCASDGKLRSRGGKGSRSKYRSDRKRYVPKRRLTRSREDESKMVNTDTSVAENVA
jgi:hypothetical protein